MKNEKFKTLLLILTLILIIVGVPYLLYTLGTFIEINYFGYLNNWWVVLLFIVVLISVFVLGEINIEKNIGYFFLILFTIPFFILGMKLGVKPSLDLESYKLLLDTEKKIDSLQLKLENDLTQLEEEIMEKQTLPNSAFKNHEILFFEYGSSKLSDFNKRKISAFISTLENRILNVNGFTDGSGRKAANMDVSTKRAENVADFIQSIDQGNNTLNKVTGFGDDHKLVGSENRTSRSKNRRVTIEIVGTVNDNTKASREKIMDEMDKNRTKIKNIKTQRDSLREIIYDY